MSNTTYKLRTADDYAVSVGDSIYVLRRDGIRSQVLTRTVGPQKERETIIYYDRVDSRGKEGCPTDIAYHEPISALRALREYLEQLDDTNLELP